MKRQHLLRSTASIVEVETFECDTPDTFCAAMKICRTTFYADCNAGLIKIVKRGRKTLVPPGERRAYLDRLSAGAAARDGDAA